MNEKLSDAAKDYLLEFYNILNDMIRGMTTAELNDSISHNFIVQMIPHHMAAIKMSENLLKYTTYTPLENIAKNIITEQTKSIENMRQVQQFCSSIDNSERDLILYQRKMDNIMHTMFSSMENAPMTNNINCDFMWEMIPHHRGAVEMSQNLLQYDICPELKPIVGAIIVSQKKGIIEMQRLLRTLDCYEYIYG